MCGQKTAKNQKGFGIYFINLHTTIITPFFTKVNKIRLSHLADLITKTIVFLRCYFAHKICLCPLKLSYRAANFHIILRKNTRFCSILKEGG